MHTTSQNSLTDIPLSSFRMITIWFRHRTEPRQHIVHESDVLPMMKALTELHHAPGVNPYTGGAASEAVEIRVQTLGAKGPYWWTTPGLKQDGNSSGAAVVEGIYTTIHWKRSEASNDNATCTSVLARRA